MNKKCIALLIGALMVMTACAAPGETPAVDEQTGEESVVEVPATNWEDLRIVSLSPSQTENLFALGLGDNLIGVSDYCDYPTEALEKEKMGSSWTINLERILEMEPDLVFTFAGGQPEAVQQMTAMGIQVVDVSPDTVDEVFQSILDTGRLTGREAKAEELVAALIQERDDIVARVKDRQRVPVFYQVWDEPLQTAGPGSFINELIELAGGENIAADAETAYPMYSVEALVEKNPEIYFMPPHVADFEALTEEMAESFREEVRNRPGYDQILAIQNNRIELLEPNIASRPGIRVIQGLRMFAEIIHPEVF